MNERIRELADEAAKFSAIMALPTGEFGDNLFVEKFAELLIRECIERVRGQYIPVRDQHVRTEREQGIVECGVASVIALEELVQESTDRWYKENIFGDEE